jgi:hypothetical protein
MDKKRLQELAGIFKEEGNGPSMQDFASKNKEYKKYIDLRLGLVIFGDRQKVVKKDEWETQGIEFVTREIFSDLMGKARAFRPTGKLYRHFHGDREDLMNSLKQYILDNNLMPSWQDVVDNTAEVFEMTPEEVATNFS